MLRKIRLTLATLFFALITLLFLDFTGTIHVWLGWLAKIQFLPALLALNVGIVVAVGVERGDSCRLVVVDIRLRTSVLFRDLPFGCFSGCGLVDQRAA